MVTGTAGGVQVGGVNHSGLAFLSAAFASKTNENTIDEKAIHIVFI